MQKKQRKLIANFLLDIHAGETMKTFAPVVHDKGARGHFFLEILQFIRQRI